jgi:hypothetical protein
MIVTPRAINQARLWGAAALIEWEDSSLPPSELYAVTPDRSRPTGWISTSHWAVLIALHAAIRHGERRLRVKGELDPVVRRGLLIAQKQFTAWYGDGEVTLETTVVPARPVAPERGTLQFFSGGVDSFATLFRNHTDFPKGHTHRVQGAIHIDWTGPKNLDDLGDRISPWQEREVQRLAVPLSLWDMDILPVVTNARSLEQYEFYLDWMFRAHGAQLAAVGHLFGASRVLIASTYDITHLAPWGSHPLVDPLYSSSWMQVLHDSPDLTRFDKVKLIARDKAVRSTLSVCSMWFERADALLPNCGRCEKCLRTLVGFAAAGADPNTLPTFECCNLPSDLVTITAFHDLYEQACWSELIGPLSAQGMESLARAVAKLVVDTPLMTQ